MIPFLEKILKLLSDMVTVTHDNLSLFNRSEGWCLSDKWLHFSVFFLVSGVVYFLSEAVFGLLAKRKVRTIAWIYTGSVVSAIIIGIEMEQALTGTGKMELVDAAAGLEGMFAFFLVYIIAIFVFPMLRTK